MNFPVKDSLSQALGLKCMSHGCIEIRKWAMLNDHGMRTEFKKHTKAVI